MDREMRDVARVPEGVDGGRIELERVRQLACLVRVEILADVDPEELALGRLRFERIVERERLIVPVGVELPDADAFPGPVPWRSVPGWPS